GDGIIQTGYPAAESCDNATTDSGIGAYCTGPCSGSGATITCSVGCTVNHGACGDGNIDYIAGEVCDDGNSINGDYCSYPACKVTGYCGDGIKQVNEACDSADPSVGEGQGVGGYCINNCQTLLGTCGDAKIQGPGYTLANYGGTLPGTGTIDGPENCDITDPRTSSMTVTTGCSSTCGRSGSCGDGIRQPRFEGCDGIVTAEPENMLLRFDETTGSTAADSSGNGNNGTVYYWKENLVTYSQDFNNGVWSSYCGNRTNFSNAAAPDLTTTALKIVMPSSFICSGSYGGWGVLQTVSPALVSGGTYTVSIWLKGASGGETIGLGLNDGHMSSVTITNTWERYSVTFTGITNVTRGLQFKGNVAGQTFYAWGAQLQNRAKPSAYIATTATAVSGANAPYDGYGMWTPGKMGNALNFDGLNDYAVLPSVNPTSAITVSAWVKSSVSTGYSGAWQIVSKYSAFILGTSAANGNNMCFIVYTTAWQFGSCYAVPDPQNWHHFVGTYDSATGEKNLYVDGVLRSTATTSGAIRADTGPIHLAHREDQAIGSNHFGGLIDDVRIYSKALTADQIPYSVYDITQTCQTGCKSNPIGILDDASRTAISGWGCDPDWPMNHANIRLEFYDRYNNSVNTRLIQTALASEQSIQNLCGGGSGHRWSFDPILVNWVGYQQPFSVKAYAVTPDGSPETDTLLGTQSFTMGPVCMDGILEGDEQCDDGNSVNTDSCRNDCKVPKCGDGIVTPVIGEVCELGATTTCVLAGITGTGVSGTATCATDCKSWVTTDKCYKTMNCANPPIIHLASEAGWNTVSSYNQTWKGTYWSPADSVTTYNSTGDSNSCRYVCGTNFAYKFVPVNWKDPALWSRISGSGAITWDTTVDAMKFTGN
ncbi:MAG TPA: DUF4215 domain-containing protein, partial [bacterium]|nr:DUF4215 domain-containing protein [bacterium]